MNRSLELLQLAINDLKVAKLILNSSNDELMQNSAAYHTQQAVEKLMKSIIEKNGGLAGITHSIGELRKDIESLGIACPDWVIKEAMTITSWATTIRYNSNFKANHDEITKIIALTEAWIEGNI